MQRDQCEDAQLLKLKVTIWVDHLVFFVVKEGKRDEGPEDLEIAFEFNQELERHIGNLDFSIRDVKRYYRSFLRDNVILLNACSATVF